MDISFFLFEAPILGLGTAGLTFFIQMLFYPNMLLNSYFEWLYKYRHLTITKIMGLCHYCQGTWIHLIMAYWHFNRIIPTLISLGYWYLITELLTQKGNMLYLKKKP